MNGTGSVRPAAFVPEYPGDNPYRQWVRDRVREKGIRIDSRAVGRRAAVYLIVAARLDSPPGGRR